MRSISFSWDQISLPVIRINRFFRHFFKGEKKSRTPVIIIQLNSPEILRTIKVFQEKINHFLDWVQNPMESSASYPIFHTPLPFNYNSRNTSIRSVQFYYKIPTTHLHSFPLFSLTSSNLSFHTKKLQSLGIKASSSSNNEIDQNPHQKLAVLLEVEGVLMDVYRFGNRKAFNSAFRKLGLDCANWPEPVYSDLIRRSAGDEEKMLVIFFNRIGWPTSVPTSEKAAFLKNVLREKKNALDELVMSKSLPLRPGVVDFIDDACKGGVPVIILTAYSKMGEKVTRPIIEKLGDDRMSKIKVIGNTEVEKSLYGQLVFGKGVSSSVDELLANEVAKAASAEKQRIAKEVASMLKLSVDIDTSTSESLKLVVATLRAGAEYAEVPVHKCVLIAGGQFGAAGAERISMPCVVLRSSFTARAEFPSANLVMDGFGGADLTVSRLQGRRWS